MVDDVLKGTVSVIWWAFSFEALRVVKWPLVVNNGDENGRRKLISGRAEEGPAWSWVQMERKGIETADMAEF